MIQVTLEDFDTERVYKTPAFTLGEGGQSCTIPAFGFLREPQTAAEEFSIGSDYFGQGRERLGRLKDSSVVHCKWSGDVSLGINVPWESYDDCGNLVSLDVNEVVHTLLSVQHWGASSTRVFHWVPEPWYYKGTLRSRPDGWTLHTGLVFLNDRYFYYAQKTGGPLYSGTKIISYPVEQVNVIAYRLASDVVYWSGVSTDVGLVDELGELDVDYLSGVYSLWTSNFTGSMTGQYYVPKLYSQVAFEDLLTTFQNAFGTSDEVPELFQFVRPEGFDFGTLALECATQLRVADTSFLLMAFDVDSIIRYAHAFRNFPSMMGDLRKCAKNVSEGIWSKNVANRYLETLYGVLPTSSDAAELVESLGKLAKIPLHQRLHAFRDEVLQDASGDDVRFTAVLTVETKAIPDGPLGFVQALIGQWRRFGMYPKVVDLWDIVPYSFVLDWIVPTGDYFEQIDDFMEVLWYFPVEHVIMSEKWTKEAPVGAYLPEEFSQASGVVNFTYYRRWVSRECPVPPITRPSLDSQLNRHWAESTALVLQRLK